MRILLTGAAGWIGSTVAKALILDDHEVHATLRPGTDLSRLRGLENRLKVWEGPMDLVPPIKPDLLIHLAWYTRPGTYLEAPENEECLAASLRLLSKVECRAVVSGTCFELDTRLGRLSETSPTRPTSLYARMKDLLRQTVEARPDSAWMRFFYQYGPSEDPKRLIPSIIRGILAGDAVKLTPGEQARDFLHVEDLARAVAAVAASPITGVVNIGSGQAHTQREIAQRIALMGGRPDLLKFGAIPYFDGEPMLIEADNRRLLSTGWTPAFDLDVGLQNAFEWWKARRGT